MKKNKLVLQPLGLILIFLLSFMTVSAQKRTDDKYPKGKYNQVYTEQKSFNKLIDVYTADAAKLSTEWQGNGFSLNTVSGNQVLSTGNYLPNTVYTATSPAIQLPAISGNEKLILQIDEKFKTESRYDYLSIKASIDGGQTWNVVYKTSGQTDWRTNYLDISRFADKNVLLSLSLNPDGANESEGWSVKGLSIFTSNGLVGTLKSKGISTKGALEQARVATIDIVNVYTDNYPDAVFVDFVPKDAQGNFVSGLDIYDLKIRDNNADVGSCLKLTESSESAAKPPIDIVFLMDNSGSMGDDQANVARNVTNMVNRLSLNYSVQLGLVRFGQGYPTDGPPIVMPNPNMPSSVFFNNTTTTDFVNFWNSVNTVDGWYEPSYWAIHEGATNGLVSFRQNAEKIFVLITDEIVSDGNNHSQYSMQDAINALNAKGIRLFAITPDETGFYNDFLPVCNATNGVLYPNITSDFSAIFDDLIQIIEQKYTLRYCPTSIMNPIDTTQCIPLMLSLKLYPNTNDNACYKPTPLPRVVRTNVTKALDNTVQNPGINIPVGVKIENGNNVTGVSFYYRTNVTTTPPQFMQGNDLTRVVGTTEFVGTIPSSVVQPNSVEYYFVAHFPNRDVLSPAQNAEYLAWSFAVSPNRPPVISNVSASNTGDMCKPVVITATIIDNDGVSTLDKKVLFYKPNNSLSGYITINMTPTETANQYTATIPGNAMDESGVSYYIVAIDNYRTQGWHGTPETPKVITTTQIPISTYNPMQIAVYEIENIKVQCVPMGANDTIRAYFINDCGQMQVAGSAGITPGAIYLRFKVYGDNPAPNSPNKDGFALNEEIHLKLIRNGKEFDLTIITDEGDSAIYYNPQSPVFCDVVQGIGSPEPQVTGNGEVIPHNDIVPSPVDGTDWGIWVPVLIGQYYWSINWHGFRLHNTGCDTLVLEYITLSDSANFDLAYSGNWRIPPGEYGGFEVGFRGPATAQATVSVYNNSQINPYKFDVYGSVGSSKSMKKQNQVSDLDMQAVNDFKIYPNPVGSTSIVNIEFEVTNDEEICELMLHDVMGKLVKTPVPNTKFSKGNHQISVNTQGLTSGTYIVTLKKGNVISSKSLIVQ